MDENINKTILSDNELDAVSGGTEQRFVEHKVVRGDTLTRLASRYFTSIEAIMRYNPIITNRNLIKIGWVLLIPDNR